MHIHKEENEMKNEERGTQNVLALTAPFTGQAIALEDVPDPVFSQKISSI